MKTFIANSVVGRRILPWLILSLLGLLGLGACAPSPTLSPTITPLSSVVLPTPLIPTATIPTEATVMPTHLPPTATFTPKPSASLSPTAVLVPSETITKDITADVGLVMSVMTGKPGPTLFVFEESHESPAGQIEIAVMLNRLYEKYGLRYIGLEGAYPEGKYCKSGYLDTHWYHPPSYKPSQPTTPREEAIVQSLAEGEVSSAELMGMVYTDAQVACIDDQQLYEYQPPDAASTAPILYLYQIALATTPLTDLQKCADLVQQQKIQEGIECVLNSNKFTHDTYAKLTDDTIVISIEEMRQILETIETKAAEVRAQITSEDTANFAAEKKFYDYSAQRTQKMAENVLTWAKQNPGTPLAMTVGAAHTKGLDKLFRQAGISFVVVRSEALARGRKEGDLSWQAYDRKPNALSVDLSGKLGALLDGRHKPGPVLDEIWEQSKVEMYVLVTSIARAAGRGDSVEQILKDLPPLTNVTLVPGSLKIVDGEVIFGANVRDINGNSVQIWSRSVTDKALAQKNLEQRLLDALEDVRQRGKPIPEPSPVSNPTPVLTRVSGDTIAIFSKDKAIIEKTRLRQ